MKKEEKLFKRADAQLCSLLKVSSMLRGHIWNLAGCCDDTNVDCSCCHFGAECNALMQIEDYANCIHDSLNCIRDITLKEYVGDSNESETNN